MSQQLTNLASSTSSSLSQTFNNMQSFISSSISYSYLGIPIITIGLIGVTSVVLAYVTITETNNNESSHSENIIPDYMNPMKPSSSTQEPSNQENEFKGGKTKRNKHKNRKTKKK